MIMTTVLRKLNSASRLSAEDWMLFLQAWVWLLVFDIGLRTRPFPELQAFASRLTRRQTPPPEQTERLLHTLRIAVDRARNNHLYPMTCLRRSLALQKMLAQRGISTELKIGVQKDANQLSSHAWLEYQGEPQGEFGQVHERFVSVMER